MDKKVDNRAARSTDLADVPTKEAVRIPPVERAAPRITKPVGVYLY
jgi:hypothetical protein